MSDRVGNSANFSDARIERLEIALALAVKSLREVGDDYPGSSCQTWCHQRADEAERLRDRDDL